MFDGFDFTTATKVIEVAEPAVEPIVVRLPPITGKCIGCGKDFVERIRKQGGGTRRKWCSHNCLSLAWSHKNHKWSTKIKSRSQKRRMSIPEIRAKRNLQGRILARNKPVEYKLWMGARQRAKDKKIDFLIQPSDIKIPKYCPLLGILLKPGSHSDSSASLDRIDVRFGYVLNNIWVISHRANTAKSNLSLIELKKLVENLEIQLTERKINETR